jgi:hypothetical protein
VNPVFSRLAKTPTWVRDICGLVISLVVMAMVFWMYFTLLFENSGRKIAVQFSPESHSSVSHVIKEVIFRLNAPSKKNSLIRNGVDFLIVPGSWCRERGQRSLVMSYGNNLAFEHAKGADVSNHEEFTEANFKRSTVEFQDCETPVQVSFVGEIGNRSAGDLFVDISIRGFFSLEPKGIVTLRIDEGQVIQDISSLVSLPPSRISQRQGTLEFEVGEEVDGLGFPRDGSVFTDADSFAVSPGIDIHARFFDPKRDRQHEFQQFVLAVIVGVASSLFLSSFASLIGRVFGPGTKP